MQGGINSFNLVCIVVGLLYVFCMVIYPFTGGDWWYVQSVWSEWQSLNTGVLAFAASIIALNAVRYSEEKRRQSRFVAARAFLPQALSELTKYFEQSSLLFIEAWERSKDTNDRCKTSLKYQLPDLPVHYKQVFKDCIVDAPSDVAEYLAYLLARLQVHHSRMESVYEEFSEDNCMAQCEMNFIAYLFSLAELQALTNRLFSFSRGRFEFDNSPLKYKSFDECYCGWNIDDDLLRELGEFTTRNYNNLRN
ncbi:hypothetical protein [Photobacterium leiognathi]|uniref:hypothetical protein n=1 Tax=Photobacterium leiognathi TaxID=553611 RepID=UPI00273A48C8|nr:hypothetical protein [Photobacterium leiognathi]